MNNLKVLDCTLRDGGYCNQWRFGKDNISMIVQALLEANLDIIECGFLSNSAPSDPDRSKFNSVDEINRIIPKDKSGKLFVAMINYGEYDADSIPNFSNLGIDGFRIAFHKKNRNEAMTLCKRIQSKGYKVFIQPMVSVSYTDFEFLDLITSANEFCPYAFYIVDSFGVMKNKDLLRFFYLVENNLSSNTRIGFHSHNNLQLAYSNAISLLHTQGTHDLIIDCSVMGMGRGAGNLNTELFVEHLNENYGAQYCVRPLLKIADEVLNYFYQKNYWGYSLANYISAKHNAHPNYASFLADKNTLSFENIDEIFDMMDSEKRVQFDKAYIEELYLQYMEKNTNQETRSGFLHNIIHGQDVVLIAPGKSSFDEKEKITALNCPLKISINFDYEFAETNYVFVSNLRRFKGLSSKCKAKSIVTTNIPYDGVFYQTSYKHLVNNVDFVEDNAGLMAIKFLSEYGAKRVFLAGFDGYSHDTSENYGDTKLQIITRNAVLDSINAGMNHVLREYAKQIEIVFLTKEKHLRLDK